MCVGCRLGSQPSIGTLQKRPKFLEPSLLPKGPEALGARRALFGKGLGQFGMPLGRLLAGFWLLLGGFWTLLGASWPPLGRFRAPLGSSQAPFGCVRRSGPRFWRVWEHAGLGFRRLGRHVLACTSLRLAFHNIMLFMNAVTTFLHLPALCFPFWCGGLCAAHGIRVIFAFDSCAATNGTRVRRTINADIRSK